MAKHLIKSPAQRLLVDKEEKPMVTGMKNHKPVSSKEYPRMSGKKMGS